MNKKQQKILWRILITGTLYLFLAVAEHMGLFAGLWLTAALFLVPYLLIGYDIIAKAARNICRGQVFDENFLMLIATVAAFCIGEFSEAVAVMLFYQIGELFQNYAVGKSRQSIAAMMDIVPTYANLEQDGAPVQVDPEAVAIDDVIIVKPGERIPLDGIVLSGDSLIDTAALTGESVPRRTAEGDAVISGCINGAGTLRVQVTKIYEDSTVARILDLVENAGAKKAKVEGFITRFARVYTPIVTICALLLAVIPPLFAGGWFDWIQRACIFLVVSCPCALVISVPMGFFGGIGAASRRGVLVKGSSYLELLSKLDTLVFDKTGTLTKGVFQVTSLLPAEGVARSELLELAAGAESLSDHPIAQSIRAAYDGPAAAADGTELAGKGVQARVGNKTVLAGSARLLEEHGVSVTETKEAGTAVYVAADGVFFGTIIIADTLKDNAAEALTNLRRAGVRRCVMLSGDRQEAAEAVAKELGLDEVHAQLLPDNKVTCVERLLAEPRRGTLAFVGDGLNDAPVLARADIGLCMGSMGADAAIEAADIVIMDDDLTKLAATLRIARKTMRIVRENIVFALAVKALVLILGALGLATMWMAVFADVGVSVLAILNALRALRQEKNT